MPEANNNNNANFHPFYVDPARLETPRRYPPPRPQPYPQSLPDPYLDPNYHGPLSDYYASLTYEEGDDDRVDDEPCWEGGDDDHVDDEPCWEGGDSDTDTVVEPQRADVDAGAMECPVVTGPVQGLAFDRCGYEGHVQKMAGWLRLFVDPNAVVELRAIDAVTQNYRRPHIVSGFYDHQHLEDMAREALQLALDAKGVYFTLNPISRDLLARCCNRVDNAQTGTTASDDHVVERRYILVDIDPVRISGVSASNDEKLLAFRKTIEVYGYLRCAGWPEPILADSGNGYHLLYAVDLPAEDGELVKRVLHALADRFDDEHVKVDRAVFNPARITKFYGTIARKGDNTADRPHRWSGIIWIPPHRQIVPAETLQLLASQAPAASSTPARSAPTPTTTSPWSVPAQTTTQPWATPAQGQMRQAEVLGRARAYLEKLPPGIAGDNGSSKTFHAACVLVQGFALSVDEAYPLIEEFNRRCQPPWIEAELRHKLNDAFSRASERGHLLRPLPTGSPEPQASGFATASIMDSATLCDTVRPHMWLINQILVADQFGVIGGAKKTLKTSLEIDMALSLATATPFLGRFEVPDPVNVLVLSGESGHAAILDAARRVADARGVVLRDCKRLRWGFQLPRLSSAIDMTALREVVLAGGIKIVIIDPLYLCLLVGTGQGQQASNLFEIGPLLLNVAQTCLAAGATPIIVHHARKQNQQYRSNEPLDLDDLSYSGVAEAARQWLLISRREPFDPAVGHHKLWLSVGGSAGHSGLYGLDVREGVLRNDFGGRGWGVTVQNFTQAKQAADRAKAAKAQEKKNANMFALREPVLEALRTNNAGMTAPEITLETGVSKGMTYAILKELLKELCVVRTVVKRPFGTGSKDQSGWLAWGGPSCLSLEQANRLRAGEPIEVLLGPDYVNIRASWTAGGRATSNPEPTPPGGGAGTSEPPGCGGAGTPMQPSQEPTGGPEPSSQCSEFAGASEQPSSGAGSGPPRQPPEQA